MNKSSNATFGSANAICITLPNWSNAEYVAKQVRDDLIASISDASYSYSKTDYAPARPDWWRCDACGHANDWRHLACAHCGAQLPTRYDP